MTKWPRPALAPGSGRMTSIEVGPASESAASGPRIEMG